MWSQRFYSLYFWEIFNILPNCSSEILCLLTVSTVENVDIINSGYCHLLKIFNKLIVENVAHVYYFAIVWVLDRAEYIFYLFFHLCFFFFEWPLQLNLNLWRLVLNSIRMNLPKCPPRGTARYRMHGSMNYRCTSMVSVLFVSLNNYLAVLCHLVTEFKHSLEVC